VIIIDNITIVLLKKKIILLHLLNGIRRNFSQQNIFFLYFNRLKSHLSTFEPQLDELKTKYDGAMREKMVYKLEKDKLQNELNTFKLGTSTPLPSKGI
jgi:hypothetical protein